MMDRKTLEREGLKVGAVSEGEWIQRFSDAERRGLAVGDELRTYAGSPAQVWTSIRAGQVPKMYCIAFLPTVCTMDVGWFLYGKASDKLARRGPIIFLDPKSMLEIRKRIPTWAEGCTAIAIKITHTSRNGQSYTATVTEW